MSADVEQAVQRANTAAFIEANPSVISLQPVTRITLPTGGTKYDTSQPKRAAQTFRVIHLSDQARPIITVDGKQYTAEIVLLGKHTAVVDRRDRWASQGHEYEVLEVQHGHGYEVKALAVRRG